jgi:hypothetical protein
VAEHRWRAGNRRPAGRSALAAGLAVAVSSAVVGVGLAPASADEHLGSPVPGTPCSTPAHACVDLATREAWLISDGEVVRGPVAITDGDAAAPTPRGTFTVEWKAEQWVSREFNVPMPYSVFFAPGGIAFHEGRQDTPSAGCVKLAHDDAKAWFEHLRVGDEVQVR